MWAMQGTTDKSMAECPWLPAGRGAGGISTQCENKNTNRSPYKGRLMACWAILGVFGHTEGETAGALELLGGFVCLWWSLGAQGSKLRHLRSHWNQEGLRMLPPQRSSLLLTSPVKQQQQQRIIYGLFILITMTPIIQPALTGKPKPKDEDFNLPDQLWTAACCRASSQSHRASLQDLKMNLPVACSQLLGPKKTHLRPCYSLRSKSRGSRHTNSLQHEY